MQLAERVLPQCCFKIKAEELLTSGKPFMIHKETEARGVEGPTRVTQSYRMQSNVVFCGVSEDDGPGLGARAALLMTAVSWSILGTLPTRFNMKASSL